MLEDIKWCGREKFVGIKKKLGMILNWGKKIGKGSKEILRFDIVLTGYIMEIKRSLRNGNFSYSIPTSPQYFVLYSHLTFSFLS